MPRQFSLQSVLSYRERIVESLEMQLAGLRAAERETITSLNQLEQTRQVLYLELARRQVGELDLTAIEQLRSQLRYVQEQIETRTRRLAELQEQIEAKRGEMLAAQQGVETLEKLKERERERCLAEEARLEAAERDDLYIARAYHRSRE